MNLKKLDEKEVIFIDQQWTENDRKQFSDLLKKKKEKKSAKQITISSRKSNTVASAHR